MALVCQRLIELTSKQALREINKGIFPAGLPDFYERMLQRVDDAPTAETIDICKQTLAVVCTVYRPITLDELPTLICLPDEAWDDLDDLKDELSWCGSFLSLQKRVISVVHQSAVDFLLKQGAACIFPAGTKHTHHSIFMQSLQSMGNVLRQDVYDLVHPGYKAQDVQQPDPDPLAAVKYSAVYWVDHLEASDAASDEMQDAKLVLFFMQTKYLYWLEALSLLFKVPEGLRATAKLQRLLVRWLPKQRANLRLISNVLSSLLVDITAPSSRQYRMGCGPIPTLLQVSHRGCSAAVVLIGVTLRPNQ